MNWKWKTPKGFTLIELLIVVAIIGIISAIAVPNLLLAIQRSKARRTMADIRSLAMAWEARNSDVGRYNAAGGVDGIDVAVSADDVDTGLMPTYMQRRPLVDAWGHDLAFFTDSAFGSAAGAKRYAIVSGGHDGVITPEILSGPFTNYDCDIVYASGSFLSYPEGFGLK